MKISLIALRALLATAFAGSALLVGCSRTPDGAALAPPIVANAQHAGVTLRYDPHAVAAAPNAAWVMIPGTLYATPLHRATQTENGLRLTLRYPPARTAQVAAARAAVVSVTYAHAPPLRWIAFGQVDTKRHLVTVEIPAALVRDALEITVALGVDSDKFRQEPPGPRYWNGTSWSASGSIAPNKKTVVLIHGIFSSVEASFPKTCPQRIADAGGFDQVLGFDYAWNEPPDAEGALFADFLKKVGAAKVSSLSVEAHSYGSLVTLAAIPKVDPAVKIANVVTMGGPLPLRGTPLAKPSNHWRMGLVLGLMDWYFGEPPSVVDRAYDSGMVASLATGSDALQKILDGVKAMQNKPRFLEAAGTSWICLVPGYVSGCWYSEEKFKSVLIDGSGVQLKWDGVVETLAANSADVPKPVTATFPLSHIDLQCGADVIKWVGKNLDK